MAEEALPPEPAPKKEVVFHIEVPSTAGLPKPERTFIRIAGLGSDQEWSSLPKEESDSPGGWLFLSPEALAAEAEAAKAAAPQSKDKKAPPKGKDAPPEPPPVEFPPPAPVCKAGRPVATPQQRQQLLDGVCMLLRVQLFRASEPPLLLGEAHLSIESLIHESSSVEQEVELVWSKQMKAELQDLYQRKLAEEAAAKAGPAGAKGAGRGSVVQVEAPQEEEEQPPPFEEPEVGRMVIKIETMAPIGRLLCPQDLYDWAVLTVHLEGCYGLPKFLEVLTADGALVGKSPSPAPAGSPAGSPLPPGSAPPTGGGIVENHPLRYSLSLLGLNFEGGRLVIPPREPAPDNPEPPAAETQEEAPESPSIAKSSPVLPEFFVEIGVDEFVEGLARAGFPGAHEVGPTIFTYLHRPRTGLGGRLGATEFERLRLMALPAEPARVLALHDKLLETHGTLADAFTALDKEAEGSILQEGFKAAVEELQMGVTETEVEALFTSLDTRQQCGVSKEELASLRLYKRLDELQAAERAAEWLSESTGSAEVLLAQLDEKKTGEVTLEGWSSGVTGMGYPDAEGAATLYKLLNLEQAPHISLSDFDLLGKIDSTAAASALLLLEELLVGNEGGGSVAAWSSLSEGAPEGGISLSHFAAALLRLQGSDLSVDPRLLFFLISDSETGKIQETDISALFAYNSATRWRQLTSCRKFLERSFGEIDHKVFKHLFDDRSESFRDAETLLPRIEWPKATALGYRGREWLQSLLNTIGDERGRKCLPEEEVMGGSWLHFFPLFEKHQQPVDFQEVQDAKEVSFVRLARWHHAQGFVDLRRLTAPRGEGGPVVEFRAYLAQVEHQPAGIASNSDLPVPAFPGCTTYIKGSIRLDRPLLRLCPRDVQPPELPGGDPYIPPPPAKPPPPSLGEELEKETSRAVARLSSEFARMCHEKGLQDVVGSDGTTLLGHKGVKDRMFLEWLRGQEGGAVLADVAAVLRPAIVRLVISENKDGPSCGLSGNENDAKYSLLRDHILAHLFRALNRDVELRQSRRDTALWRSPPLTGSHEQALLPSEAPPTEDNEQQQKQLDEDTTLCRLALEYELLGDWHGANALFQERLRSQLCKENPEAWIAFARFLMRSGQKQSEAEHALRYAASLRRSSEGPSLHESIFLASLLQNLDWASSLVAEGPFRFVAAQALLTNYLDRHPGERLPLFALFGVLAAAFLREAQEAQTETGAEDEDGKQVAAGLHAEAMKYLALARASPKIFNGTLVPPGPLGKPYLPELVALVKKEKANRGEIPNLDGIHWQPPSPTPEPPPAEPAGDEEPPQPEPLPPPPRIVPDAEDEPALEFVDLLLHYGVPSLVQVLLTHAVEEFGFVSPTTQSSDRCRLQLIKAALLAGDVQGAQALAEGLLSEPGAEKVQEAHLLLGECWSRAAREAEDPETAREHEAAALVSFEAALACAPEAYPEDPVLQLRIASILQKQAEDSNFADLELVERVIEHCKRSIMTAPTAEAWKNVGVCTFHKAQQAADARTRRKLLNEAMKYLSEANILDRRRPEINSWVAACAAELGRVQAAKQCLREVLRNQENLDFRTRKDVDSLLLRLSEAE